MTREIPLTRGKIAIVDAEDYDRLAGLKWTACKCVRKGREIWRACRWVGGRGARTTIYMHRVIVAALDGELVDHRDGDDLNNRKNNLRRCTPTKNQQNRFARHNKTGFKGVRLRAASLKRGYCSEITVEGRTKHLGYFSTAEAAAHAYDTAARAAFGEFANCNFPEGVQ